MPSWQGLTDCVAFTGRYVAAADQHLLLAILSAHKVTVNYASVARIIGCTPRACEERLKKLRKEAKDWGGGCDLSSESAPPPPPPPPPEEAKVKARASASKSVGGVTKKKKKKEKRGTGDADRADGQGTAHPAGGEKSAPADATVIQSPTTSESTAPITGASADDKGRRLKRIRTN